MSEELNQNETAAETPAEVAPVVETETALAPEAEVAPQEPAAEEAVATPTPTQPQVIVQRERGFSHYVGFALLSVLCICFYFMPGIAITFAISLIPGISLGAVAAWTFSAIFSVIAWAIFKMKIKGFKKSFYFYIGLCVLVFILLTVIEILTEETNVFAKIFALLCGAA
jgi:hypothetical protein